MKTFDDYKKALREEPSDLLAEDLIAQAKADGFTAWQLVELAGERREIWA